MPFVPPVTNAFLDFNCQKLAGGGGGTDNSLELAATERMASPKKTNREIIANLVLVVGCSCFATIPMLFLLII